MQTVRFNTNVSVSFAPTSAPFAVNGILETPNVGANNVTFTSAGTMSGNVNGNNATIPGVTTVWQNNTGGEIDVPVRDCQQNHQHDELCPGRRRNGLLSASNSYTGQTYLNGGNTMVTANNRFGAQAGGETINLNGGTVVGDATFSMDNGSAASADQILVGNAGGGLAAVSGFALTVDGSVGGVAGAGPLSIGIPASGANGNVAGLLPARARAPRTRGRCTRPAQ